MHKLADALFLSDLHLQEDQPEIWALAEAVLRQATDKGLDLYILGDLFESWIGDDGAGPFERQVMHALAACTKTTSRVYLQHGNRDFLLGDAFLRATGAELLPDPCKVLAGQERILLSHGDIWCTDDLAYQQLRTQVRDPAWQQAMLSQPVQVRQQMAQQAREQSRAHQQAAMESILDVNKKAVEQAFLQHEVTRIIHGHTHRPATHTHELEGKTRIRHVLGDWHPQAEMLLYREGQFQNINTRDFLQT